MIDRQKLSNHAEIKKATSRHNRVDGGTTPEDGEVPFGNPRRDFLRQLGGVAAATLTIGASSLGPLAEPAPADAKPLRATGKRRAENCFDLRHDAALDAREVAMPTQAANGDEQLYPNYIGNFSKGLPHNAIGEVAPDAYRAPSSTPRTTVPQGPTRRFPSPAP